MGGGALLFPLRVTPAAKMESCCRTYTYTVPSCGAVMAWTFQPATVSPTRSPSSSAVTSAAQAGIGSRPTVDADAGALGSGVPRRRPAEMKTPTTARAATTPMMRATLFGRWDMRRHCCTQLGGRKPPGHAGPPVSRAPKRGRTPRTERDRSSDDRPRAKSRGGPTRHAGGRSFRAHPQRAGCVFRPGPRSSRGRCVPWPLSTASVHLRQPRDRRPRTRSSSTSLTGPGVRPARENRRAPRDGDCRAFVASRHDGAGAGPPARGRVAPAAADGTGDAP